MNDNADISILPISPKCSRRAHVSPEEDWNFPGKNCWKLGCFCINKNKKKKLTVTKYGFLHVYKVTTYLVSLAKSLPLQ